MVRLLVDDLPALLTPRALPGSLNPMNTRPFDFATRRSSSSFESAFALPNIVSRLGPASTIGL
jgi:hypothetical protein